MNTFTAILTCSLIAIFMAGAPSFSAYAQSCDGVNNRGVEKLTFKRDTNGTTILQAKVGVSIGRSKARDNNMSFNLRVSINGVPMALVAEDIVYESAITCAVTCAGDCPSIFGDGVCSGCNCDYGDWFAIPLPGIQEDDVVMVELLAARGGEKDTNRRDNKKRITFKAALLK